MAQNHFGNVPARRGMHLGAGAWARALLARDIVRQRMPGLMQGLREWQQAKQTCPPREAADRAGRVLKAVGEEKREDGDISVFSISIKKEGSPARPPPLL